LNCSNLPDVPKNARKRFINACKTYTVRSFDQTFFAQNPDRIDTMPDVLTVLMIDIQHFRDPAAGAIHEFEHQDDFPVILGAHGGV
jgi:hypothetical protein